MSMIDRYRKNGGFQQLLLLIESCPQAKQEKLIIAIQQEDAIWGEAIRQKMIQYDRIFTWPADTLREIFGTLPDSNIAILYTNSPPQRRELIQSLFTKARLRKIEDIAAIQAPSSGEVVSIRLKLVETVRKMAIDHYLRFEHFDLDLVISSEFEEDLLRSHLELTFPRAAKPVQPTNKPFAKPNANGDVATTSSTASNESSDEPPLSLNEFRALKRRIAELMKENAELRAELDLAQGRIEKIRKII
jgi:hypothetical protein